MGNAAAASKKTVKAHVAAENDAPVVFGDRTLWSRIRRVDASDFCEQRTSSLATNLLLKENDGCQLVDKVQQKGRHFANGGNGDPRNQVTGRGKESRNR